MTKSISKFAIVTVLFTSFSAHAADLTPILYDTPEQEVANTANRVNNVFKVKTQTKQYKIVSMDTPLNGNFDETAILFVGDEVGGEAGYEAAFKIAPTPDLKRVKSVVAVGNSIQVTYVTVNTKTVKKVYTFDTASGNLKTK